MLVETNSGLSNYLSPSTAEVVSIVVVLMVGRGLAAFGELAQCRVSRSRCLRTQSEQQYCRVLRDLPELWVSSFSPYLVSRRAREEDTMI